MISKEKIYTEMVLDEWRVKVLNGLLLIVCIIGLIALVPNVVKAYYDPGLRGGVIFLALCESITIVITFARKIKVSHRVYVMLFLGYLIASINMYDAGISGRGISFFIIIPIFALIFLGRWAGIYASILSVLIVAVFTFLINTGAINPANQVIIMEPWMGFGSMLLLLSTEMVLLVLFYSFQEHLIAKERCAQANLIQVQTLLKEQNSSLEEKIRERTEELQQRNKVTTALFKMTEASSASRDTLDFFTSIHHIISELMYAKNLFIALYDETTGLLSFPYFVDEKDEPNPTQPLKDFPGLTSYMIRTGNSIKHGWDQYNALITSHEAFPVGSYNEDGIGVPLKVEGKTIGAIYVQSYIKGIHYTEQDDEILESVAQHIAITLTRFRSLEAERQRTIELSIINKVQEGLSSKLELDAIYELIGEKVREVFNVQVVDIVIYDSIVNLISMPYSYEKGDRSVIEPREPYGIRLEVIKTCKPLLINQNFIELATQYSNPLLTGEWPKSVLFVPLVVDEMVKGIISIQDLDRENAFTESDVRLLQTLANAMSIALENARLYDETQRLLEETEQRNAELQIINGVQQGLASKLDFQSTVDLVGDRLRKDFNAPDLGIIWYDPRSKLIHHPYLYEHGGRLTLPARSSETDELFQRLVRTQKPIFWNTEKEGNAISPAFPGTDNSKSGACVPIICSDRVLGSINFENYEREYAYGESERRLLKTIAASLGAALENARLFEETQHLLKETEQRNAELAVINSVQSGLASELDLRSIIDLVGDKLREAFVSPNLFINLYDEKENIVHYFYAYKHGNRLDIPPQPPQPGGIIDTFIRTHQVGCLEYTGEIGADSVVIPGTQACKSGIAVPIISGDRIFGFLHIENFEREHAFDEAAKRLLTTISASLGTALEKIQLTNQKNQAIESLRQSEEKFRKIVNNLPQFISIWDLNMDCTYVSPSIFHLTGYTPEERLAMKMEKFLSPETIDDLERTLKEELKKGLSPDRDSNLVVTRELEEIRKDGSKAIFETSFTFLRDTSGTEVAILGITADITERKRSEQALIDSERRLSDIINFLPIATMVIDREGRVTAWNHAIEEMTGIKEEAMIGKGDYEYSLPFYGKRVPVLIDLVFTPQEEIETEYKYVRREGEILTAETFCPKLGEKGTTVVGFASPLYSSEGKIIGAIESLRDMTELREAENKLKQAKEAAEVANRSKSAFLANMSHEIRTPMNAILGFAQLMQRDTGLSPRQRENLDIINRSGLHLLALINDVLELSKIEAGRLTFIPITFDLHKLLDDIEMMFRVRTDEKKLWLLVEKVGDVPRWVITDEGKLRQVLINLIGNAVKFTEVGGIGLRVRAHNDESGKMRLLFEIEDTGTGISLSEIENLFKAFEQASAGMKMGGTGLGLALSKGFIQMMGGTISVASEVGKGSIFRFIIPVEEGKKEHSESQEMKKHVVSLKPGQREIHILIADDKETNRHLLTQMLSMVGFDTREVVNGKEAIAAFETWKPQVILMDMTMPVMDGYEATRRIKASTEGKNVMIIAITASAFQEDKQRVMASGADGYLSKPFKEVDLFETIRQLLGIEYIYEDEVRGEQTIVEDDISLPWNEGIDGLPLDLIRQCIEATDNADIFRLMELLEEVAKINKTVAEKLNDLAGRYAYEEIINLLSTTNK